MNDEIPQRRKPDWKVKFTPTREIGLAAACLADSRVARLGIRDIHVYVEGDRRESQFNFPPTREIREIFNSWRACSQGDTERYNDRTALIYRAFHYSNRFVNLIRARQARPKPRSIPPSFVWTINTKVAATTLALVPVPMLPEEKLRTMLFYDGFEYGYLISDREVLAAYVDPENYVKENPDKMLAYLVAAFYHREHLRDLVKRIPARHVFRNGEDEVAFIAENSVNLGKEIPCLTKQP